jgi:DNA-binding winged helix-turn-helix (wHTH) protein
VSLGGRARELLVLLAERAGEVVEKGDLMARVWPDVFVEEGTLRVHIAALRKALGDGRDGLRYIENVTGRGYRLIAPVRRLGAPHPSLLDADPEVSVEPISTRSRHRSTTSTSSEKFFRMQPLICLHRQQQMTKQWHPAQSLGPSI